METKLTRGETLIGALGILLRGRHCFAKASQPATPVNFAVPPNPCDHRSSRAAPKTPETAMPDAVAALHRALHMGRVVIVTPSISGTDIRHALRDEGKGTTARGVAVIDDKTLGSELDRMPDGALTGLIGARNQLINIAFRTFRTRSENLERAFRTPRVCPDSVL